MAFRPTCQDGVFRTRSTGREPMATNGETLNHFIIHEERTSAGVGAITSRQHPDQAIVEVIAWREGITVAEVVRRLARGHVF